MTRLELKEKIKALSLEIRQMKSTRKTVEYGFVRGLIEKKYDARCHHVAASLLRGRTLEQIERPSDDNPLYMHHVEYIMNSIVEVKDETLCDCKE